MSYSILSNTIWSIGGRIFTTSIGIIIVSIISRWLGAQQYGTYALILSFGALLHVMTDWGLYLTLTRQLAQHPSQRQHILSVITGLRLAIVMIIFTAGGIVLVLIPAYRSLFWLYSIAALGFLAQSLSQLLMGVYQTYGVMWRAAAGDSAGRLVQLIVIGMFAGGLLLTPNPILVAVAAFTAGAFGAYFVHSVLVPQLQPWRMQYVWPMWKETLHQSWPLGLMLILGAVYFRIDILMISWFRPSIEVGWYGLAYRIIESLLFIPAAFGGILLPRLSQSFVSGRSIQKLLEQALHLMGIAAGGALAIFFTSSSLIVQWLSGNEFLPSAPLLVIISAALAFMFIGNIFGFTLVAAGRQYDLLKLYAVLAVVNVISNGLTIPIFGAIAAAWTTLATEAAATIIAGYHLRTHLRKAFLLDRITGLSIALVPAAGVGLWAGSALHPYLGLIAALFIYLGILWITGQVHKKQFNLLLTSS